MSEECKHDWKIWGVDNTTDMNKMYQCAKCGELVDEALMPYNGHLPAAIFQGQGDQVWQCSPKCPKCNPSAQAPLSGETGKADEGEAVCWNCGSVAHYRLCNACIDAYLNNYNIGPWKPAEPSPSGRGK